MTQIIQMSKIEKRGNLWVVLVASPVAESGWIIGGEHLTEFSARIDAAWYRQPLNDEAAQVIHNATA